MVHHYFCTHSFPSMQLTKGDQQVPGPRHRTGLYFRRRQVQYSADSWK